MVSAIIPGPFGDVELPGNPFHAIFRGHVPGSPATGLVTETVASQLHFMGDEQIEERILE